MSLARVMRTEGEKRGRIAPTPFAAGERKKCAIPVQPQGKGKKTRKKNSNPSVDRPRENECSRKKKHRGLLPRRGEPPPHLTKKRGCNKDGNHKKGDPQLFFEKGEGKQGGEAPVMVYICGGSGENRSGKRGKGWRHSLPTGLDEEGEKEGSFVWGSNQSEKKGGARTISADKEKESASCLHAQRKKCAEKKDRLFLSCP